MKFLSSFFFKKIHFRFKKFMNLKKKWKGDCLIKIVKFGYLKWDSGMIHSETIFLMLKDGFFLIKLADHFILESLQKGSKRRERKGHDKRESPKWWGDIKLSFLIVLNDSNKMDMNHDGKIRETLIRIRREFGPV